MLRGEDGDGNSDLAVGYLELENAARNHHRGASIVERRYGQLDKAIGVT
jgi:hypothetical protein